MRSTVSPASHLPLPTLIPPLPQAQMLIHTRLPPPLLHLRLFMRTNLLQSVSSVSLLLARLSSFRAVTSLLAETVQSTWLNLGREATLYIMKQPQAPVRKLPPERGAAAQRIRAVRPRGLSRRPSPLRIRVENARLRGGSALFADNVSIFLKNEARIQHV